MQFLEETRQETVLTAFFSPETDTRDIWWRLQATWQEMGLPQSESMLVSQDTVPQRDWVGQWRRDYRPVPIGKHFLITPSWYSRAAFERTGDAAATRRARSTAPAGLMILLDPENAFGSGTHASTRLCLLGIAEFYKPGTKALDIGTGSGILAIAMALLGGTRSSTVAARAYITAIDSDPDAVRTARRNALRNNANRHIRFRCTHLDAFHTIPHPFVIANLTAVDLLHSVVPLAALCAPGGILALSGLQVTDLSEVRSAFRHAGFKPARIRNQEGWALLVLLKVG